MAYTEPTLSDIYSARARIGDVIRPTPLLQHALLTEKSGLNLHVKHENHNPTSAFKVRGGLNLV
jgi:threonine dehydratase